MNTHRIRSPVRRLPTGCAQAERAVAVGAVVAVGRGRAEDLPVDRTCSERYSRYLVSSPYLVSSDPPNYAYYRACEGRWRCDFDFGITDPAAFRAAPLAWIDRRRIASVIDWARWAGPFYLLTTVECKGPGEVLHTTRLNKFGISFLHSVETITLDPNGRDFTLRGSQRYWPTGLWRSRGITGHGKVDETATRATYEFTWFGTQMQQSTLRHEHGVDLLQQSPWSRGTQRLRRVSALPQAPTASAARS